MNLLARLALAAALAAAALPPQCAESAFAMGSNPPPPTAPVANMGTGADVTISADAAAPGLAVAPGAFGYNAQWRMQDGLAALCGPVATDADQAACLEKIGAAYGPMLAEAGARNLAFLNWGNTLGTWGDPLSSAGPWSARKLDCNPGSGLCERDVVGVGDVCALAKRWRLEAITFPVPLTGADPFTKVISDAAAARIVDYAAREIAAVGCAALTRYVGVGVEWSPLGPAFAQAQASYLKLLASLRARVEDPKVVLLVYGMLGARYGGAQAVAANAVNQPLYALAMRTPGLLIDLHPYLIPARLAAAPDGSTPMTDANVDALLRIAPDQSGFLTVAPAQWGATGPPAPGAVAEFSAMGLRHDVTQASEAPWPWEATLALADLSRECLASGAAICLNHAWTTGRPPEWPMDAVSGGALTDKARALGFLAAFHRGGVLPSLVSAGSVRGTVTREGATLRAYGGNFSRTPVTLGFRLFDEAAGRSASVEIRARGGVTAFAWDGAAPLALPPLSLWRAEFH